MFGKYQFLSFALRQYQNWEVYPWEKIKIENDQWSCLLTHQHHMSCSCCSFLFSTAFILILCLLYWLCEKSQISSYWDLTHPKSSSGRSYVTIAHTYIKYKWRDVSPHNTHHLMWLNMCPGFSIYIILSFKNFAGSILFLFFTERERGNRRGKERTRYGITDSSQT